MCPGRAGMVLCHAWGPCKKDASYGLENKAGVAEGQSGEWPRIPANLPFHFSIERLSTLLRVGCEARGRGKPSIAFCFVFCEVSSRWRVLRDLHRGVLVSVLDALSCPQNRLWHLFSSSQVGKKGQLPSCGQS